MHPHTSVNLIALGAAAIVAASCNAGLAGPNGAVAAIQVTATVDTAFALGDTVPFHATATDASGAALSGVTYTWTSSAPTVATVSKTGVVIAVGNGAATIQAAVNGVTGAAPFAVRQVAVGLAVSLTHDTIATIGHTVQATARPVDARGNALPTASATWTSSNPAVATVDDTGLVRGIATGRAMIRAEVTGIRDSVLVTMHQYPDTIRWSQFLTGYLWSRAGQSVYPATFEARDSAGHLLAADNSSVVRAYISAGAGSLGGRTHIPLTGGLATFDSLVVSGMVGTRTVTFAVEGTTAATSVPLYVQSGPPATIFAVSGEDQSGPVGTLLSLPLKVKVVDAFNNPTSAQVTWTTTGDSGVVESPATWTESYGLAITSYRLGLTAGTDTVYASLDDLSGSPVTFIETVTPAPANAPTIPRPR